MRSAFVLATLLLVGGIWAQKPTGGTVTAEVGLQGAINNINIAIAPIRGARLRYFLGDNLAVRLGLNLQSQSHTDRDFENPDGTGGVGEEKNTYFLFGFRPGVEYHFAGGEKLSTFAGAQLILDITSAKTTRTNYVPGGGYTPNFTQTVDGEAQFGPLTYNKGTTFGLGLYSGFDWYFTEKVYLGIEWGLNFTSTSNSDVTTTTSAGGITTIQKTAGSREGGLAVSSVGVLRLGYQF
jgi:hypothetical protein